MSEANEFLGSFNKAKNLKESEFAFKKWGEKKCFFDKTIYKKVSQEIEAILGEKKKYTGKEAFRYFQRKYAAYPIDIRYYYNYTDTREIDFGFFDEFTVSKDESIDSLSDYSGELYTYINRGNNEDKESALTFVIDVLSNPFFRKEHPEFEEFERKEYQKMRENPRMEQDEEGRFWEQIDGIKVPWVIGSNIIVVIGSLDGKSINSMKVLCGETSLPEVEYALEFFRRHS